MPFVTVSAEPTTAVPVMRGSPVFVGTPCVCAEPTPESVARPTTSTTASAIPVRSHIRGLIRFMTVPLSKSPSRRRIPAVDCDNLHLAASPSRSSSHSPGRPTKEQQPGTPLTRSLRVDLLAEPFVGSAGDRSVAESYGPRATKSLALGGEQWTSRPGRRRCSRRVDSPAIPRWLDASPSVRPSRPLPRWAALARSSEISGSGRVQRPFPISPRARGRRRSPSAHALRP